MTKLAIPIFAVLVVIGIIMLASAGSIDAQKKFDDAYFYPKHQIFYGLLPGLIVFYLCSRIPYQTWKRFAFPLLILALVLMVLVFIPGLGDPIKGARRWVDLGFFSFQPAEFLKLALVIYLAAWFSKKRSNASELVPFFLMLALLTGLIIKQPDFGTLAVVIVISVGLYFFSGAKLWHFGVLILILAVFMGGLALAAPYRFDRIKTFLNPEHDTQGASYHINQALISIGSGGMWGLGYGQSKQKSGFLPEPVGDSIFAVIAEEMGLFGSMILLGLFLLLIISLGMLGRQVHDPFGMLIVLGIATWISAQTLLNIGAITGVFPLTGVPLPLISYGSSALLSIMAGMGIVRSISRAS